MYFINAIIAPHFNYCNVVWGNCNQTLQNKLQVLQNRAFKIIKGVDRLYTSSTQILKDLMCANFLKKSQKIESSTCDAPDELFSFKSLMSAKCY